MATEAYGYIYGLVRHVKAFKGGVKLLVAPTYQKRDGGEYQASLPVIVWDDSDASARDIRKGDNVGYKVTIKPNQQRGSSAIDVQLHAIADYRP